MRAAGGDVHLPLEPYRLEAGRPPPDRRFEPARVEHVELGNPPGELQRMVVAEDDDRHADPDPLGALQHADRELQRIGHQVVVVEMVLHQPDRVVAELLGEQSLLGHVVVQPVLAALGAQVVRTHEHSELHRSALLVDWWPGGYRPHIGGAKGTPAGRQGRPSHRLSARNLSVAASAERWSSVSGGRSARSISTAIRSISHAVPTSCSADWTWAIDRWS